MRVALFTVAKPPLFWRENGEKKKVAVMRKKGKSVSKLANLFSNGVLGLDGLARRTRNDLAPLVTWVFLFL